MSSSILRVNCRRGASLLLLALLAVPVRAADKVEWRTDYDSARKEGNAEPLAAAVKESWNPCMLSTLTTLLGLVSLNVSSILPVSQFGYAAACGSLVALVVGLGVTPALLNVMPHCTVRSVRYHIDFRQWGTCVAAHRWGLLGGSAVLLAVTAIGILQLQPSINTTEFLPLRQVPVLLAGSDAQRLTALTTEMQQGTRSTPLRYARIVS